MEKDSNGLWSVTTTPQAVGFHYYWFMVDGVNLSDPASDSFFGVGRHYSGSEVPSKGEDFYDTKDVPHGELRMHYYHSEITKAWRRCFVYTPPGYDKETGARYPVLFLLHGAGEDETGWGWQSRANFILDNLIAEGKAKPMILVMDNGGGGTIYLLKDDLSGFAESHAVKLENPDRNPSHHGASAIRNGMNWFGHEGAILFKANGKYYHGAVDDYEGRYSSCVAIADNIWGPYRNWHETVPCGGGTDFFQDKEGNCWCAFFGNDAAAPWREMPGIVRVDFDPAGKIFVAKTQPAFVLQDPKP
jgi:hypothetical protein